MAGRRCVAAAIGLLLAVGDVAPVWAHAERGVTPAMAPASHWLFAKKKKPAKPAEEPGPRLTPDGAETKRQAIRDAVKSAQDAGDYGTAADGLERNAAQLGDPVTMLEAAEARLEAAKKDRRTQTAEAAIETSRRALDILHFYSAVNNGEASTDWLVIEPGDASALIERGDGVVSAAESLIEEIEAESASAVATGPTDDGKKKRRRRTKGEPKPGAGMIAGGSILTVVGVAGVSMVVAGTVISASKQNEVEKFDAGDPEVDKLDDEGRQANLVAYIGAGVAVVGFAVGLPLLILGVKKRKAGKGPPATASRRSSLVVAPVFGAGAASLSVQGRF